MTRRIRPATAALAGAGLILAATAGPAAAGSAPAAPAFAAPVRLPNIAGGGGGEPSIAAAPGGDGSFYVTTPQSIPAILNRGAKPRATPNQGNGIAVWASHDHAHSFDAGKNVGSAFGGGDSDVTVAPSGRVYVADLEGASSAICASADKGRTYHATDGSNAECSGLPLSQAGIDEDRQWLNAGPGGKLFLSYHDLSALNVPVVLLSTDQGKTFPPASCGAVIDPLGPIARFDNPQSGNLVSKPALDKAGALNLAITMDGDNGQGQDNGAFGSGLYFAKGDCADPSKPFSNTVIFNRDGGARLTNIFSQVAVDGSGRIYVVAAGAIPTVTRNNESHVWLFTSTDAGAHWSVPQRVDAATAGLHDNALPALTTGAGPGEVAVGWFGATQRAPVTDVAARRAAQPAAADTAQAWRYYAAVSHSGGTSWSAQAVTGVLHHGGICTLGIACVQGNRNLLDFSSAVTDPRTGCVVFAVPGDPANQGATTGKPTNAYVVRQTAGCLTPSVVAAPAPRPSTRAAPGAGAATVRARAAAPGRGLAATGLPVLVPFFALLLFVAAVLLRRPGRR